tara:strand:+ start:106 stop:639 length:534 start_codon:yes stop_codon:yes gene_type:complete
MRGSGANSGGTTRYRIANTFATNMFSGDVVKLGSGGTVEVITTTTDHVIGVLQGVEYVDPVSRQPIFGRYWPASTSSVDATPYATVMDNPASTYTIQADATVTAGDVGMNYTVTLGAGSTMTGRSGFGLKVAGRAATTAMLQVIGLSNVPDNAFGDVNPRVEVRLVQHVDSYTSAAR